MKYSVFAIPVLCACLVLAGCTTPVPMSVNPGPATTPQPVSPLPTGTLPPGAECTSPADCIPAECCHPTGCIAGPRTKPCTLMCTASCEGPLDCGAGSCGCVNGKCSIVPGSLSSAPRPFTPLTVTASPGNYSPIMSSTPGIGLEPVLAGAGAENATFAWKASYGHFLTWNAPDYTINETGDTATSHGEKIYWSFIDKPASTATPVTITVTATETGSGRQLGSATVTLSWVGDYAVSVDKVP